MKRTIETFIVALLASAIALEAQAQALPGAMIDIGGYRVHLVCNGDGDRTIFLDAGAGGWSFTWFPIQTKLASAGFRVCSWDRPGVGLSDAGPLPRTSATIVREMQTLMDRAQLDTPIVLVGYSFGGQNVRMFAATYPDLVAGVVLVDSGHENQWTKLAPTIWQAVEDQVDVMRNIAAAIRNGADAPPSGVPTDRLPLAWRDAVTRAYHGAQHYQGVANELAAIPESNAQLAQSGHLGAIPLLVLTAGRSFYAFEGAFDTDIAAANDIWLGLQRDLLTISTRARHVVEPDVDHRLVSTHPELVAGHIVEFVRSLPGLDQRSAADAEVLGGILERMTEAYAHRDALAFTSLFTDDVVVNDVNRRQLVEGRNEWRELSRRVMDAHRWMHLEATPVALSGNRATVKLRWSGLLRGEVLGRENDVEYDYEGVSLMELEGNMIARHELYIDYASFRDQVGDTDRTRRVATLELAWHDYVEAWRSRDLERIVSFFEVDVHLLPTSGKAITNRADFATWLEDNYREFTSVSLEGLGLSIYETEAARHGRYHVSVDGFEVQSGYFMQVWHLAPDGRWRIKRCIFNVNGNG